MPEENEIVIRVRRDREGDGRGGGGGGRDGGDSDDGGRRRGGGARGAFLGGVVGGAVGSVAGAALGGLMKPFDPLLQALGGVMASIFLPFAIAFMPLLVDFARLVLSSDFQQLLQTLAGLVSDFIELFGLPVVQFALGLTQGADEDGIQRDPSSSRDEGEILHEIVFGDLDEKNRFPAKPGSALASAQADYAAYLQRRGIVSGEERPFDVAVGVGIGVGHAAGDIVQRFFPFLSSDTQDPDAAYQNPSAARTQGGP